MRLASWIAYTMSSSISLQEELRSRNVGERWMDDSLGIGMSRYFVLDIFFFSKKFFNLNSI